MTSVYLVMTSNCEEWEDYHESVDSAWRRRCDAVAHIEGHLGMKQVERADPERDWTRDRWLREDVVTDSREDYGSDAEWQEVLAGDGGEPAVIMSYERDAWVVEMPLLGGLGEWMRHGEEG